MLKRCFCRGETLLKLAWALDSLWQKQAAGGRLAGQLPAPAWRGTGAGLSQLQGGSGAATNGAALRFPKRWRARVACFSENTCTACFPNPQVGEWGL